MSDLVDWYFEPEVEAPVLIRAVEAGSTPGRRRGR